jgi:uncharacterized protein (TIGR04255 family)
MRFADAPLIEVAAEFRWLPTATLGEPMTSPPAIGMPGPQSEAFFEKLRAALSNIGYSAVERLIPEGFPLPIYQPVFRYRRPHETETNELFQVGIGTFSVHALPRYENWERFQPVITTGLVELLMARNATAQLQTAFTRVSLHYINAFTPKHMNGQQPYQFIRDVVGLKVELPPSLEEQVTNPSSLDIGLGLTVDIVDDLQFALTVGKNVRFPGSLILDIGAQTERPLPWADAEPMAVLSRAHAAIRRAFLGMTTQLHELMGREE